MIFPSTSKNGKRRQSSSGLRKNLEINAERKTEIANETEKNQGRFAPD